MAAVGLLYVGAVLFMNGLMLLGLIDTRAAAGINLFVGSLQVITPTYLIIAANGNQSQILAASGIYLFGFTYLYVGIGLLAGFDGTGIGYFSLFVAIMAIGYSYLSFDRLDDSRFGVIWLYWSFLWLLFWALLGLGRAQLTAYTGWVAAIEGWVTAAIPAFMILDGDWAHHSTAITVALGVVLVAMAVGLVPFTRPSLGPPRPMPQQQPTPAQASAPLA